ncbi:hypothetical protein [Staphylococcus pettenkoferi]|uniref:hypothetical protein n=1 Tax=Staphylococcus pettenkoferi TaxID=170573 RepID=UPI0022746EA2|nr:hypothetical protein [Staphylococcus pettenkoferi]MCY1600435.1 hypothetical protein [Staphylococcus pettenkoferi]
MSLASATTQIFIVKFWALYKSVKHKKVEQQHFICHRSTCSFFLIFHYIQLASTITISTYHRIVAINPLL